MVEPHMVRVLGRSAFHDTALTVSGDLCYLGGEVYFILSPFSFSLQLQLQSQQALRYLAVDINK